MNEPALRIEDGELQRGEKLLFSGLSLTVGSGEFLAVVGANGTGKTSLLRVVLGLQKLNVGSVSVLGTTPTRARTGVGYLPQNDVFDAELPMRGVDFVRLGVNGNRWGFSGKKQSLNDAATALRSVEAESFAQQRVGRLSGGQQQRLRIAHALAAKPRLLLMDEPFNFLDHSSQDRVAELLARQVKDTATACIVVTHDVEPITSHLTSILHLTADGHQMLAPGNALPAIGGH